ASWKLNMPPPSKLCRSGFFSESTSSRHDYIRPLDALIAPRVRQTFAAELAKQLRFPLPGILQMAIPDMSVTADLFRKGGEFHGDAMIAGVEALHQVTDHLLVVGDQLAVHLPVPGVAEDIQSATSQPLESRQHLEDVQHPWAIGLLSRFTR